MFSLRADAAAPLDAAAADGEDGGDAADNFLPIDDNMELDQNPEEHVDRHQVSVLVFCSIQLEKNRFFPPKNEAFRFVFISSVKCG